MNKDFGIIIMILSSIVIILMIIELAITKNEVGELRIEVNKCMSTINAIQNSLNLE